MGGQPFIESKADCGDPFCQLKGLASVDALAFAFAGAAVHTCRRGRGQLLPCALSAAARSAPTATPRAADATVLAFCPEPPLVR